MNAKRILRMIALAMLAAAVIFFYIAINVPTLGHVFSETVKHRQHLYSRTRVFLFPKIM